MPQEMHALRCYSCEMYQVHIVKKSHRWTCKICNENQSIQTIYCRGSGAQCREFVSKKNIESIKNPGNPDYCVGTVEAWGLDCKDAENRSPNCLCPRKSLDDSSDTNRSDEDDDSPLGNCPKRRKMEKRHVRSLPAKNSVDKREKELKSLSFPRPDDCSAHPTSTDVLDEPKKLLPEETDDWTTFLEREKSQKSDERPLFTQGKGISLWAAGNDHKPSSMENLQNYSQHAESNNSSYSFGKIVGELFADADEAFDLDFDDF